MSQVVLEPEKILHDSAGSDSWMVVIFNNHTNTLDEVVEVLMLATGCDLEEALTETWEAHTFGKARVHFASKPVCDEVAATISVIGVATEVSKEWLE